MNIKTLKNKASAMNLVHKIANELQPQITALFPECDGAMYKSDGTINKRAKDAIKAIINNAITGHVSIVRCYVDDTYNSVTINLCARYDVFDNDGNYRSTSYYKHAVHVVTISSYSKGEQTINKPINYDSSQYPKNFTAKKLLAMQIKREKLEDKRRELDYEISRLNFWLND